jgi:RHS repeat-associated protein
VDNSIGSYSTAWFTYGADQQPARQWGFEGTPDCINAPATQGGCLRHHRIYLDRYEDTVGSFRHFEGSERLYRSRAYVGDYLVATRGRYGELELSFLLRDRLGSVVGVEGVTLNNRNITAMRAETRHSFDAYGTPRSNFKRAGSLWSEQPRWSSPTRTQQGFTGHERLSGLQLIHMRGRVFDPQLGRFHGVDPIIQFPLSSQGLNPYSYILNNPLAGVDPTGYAVCVSDDECTISMSEVETIEFAKNGEVTLVVGKGEDAERYVVHSGQEGKALVGFGIANGADPVQGTRAEAGAQEADQIGSLSRSDARLSQILAGPSGGLKCDPMVGAFLSGTRTLTWGLTPLLMNEQDKAHLAAYDEKVGAWPMLLALFNPRDLWRHAAEMGTKKAILRNADEVAHTAEATADAARSAGRTSGAAAELRVGDRVFTDVSTGGAARHQRRRGAALRLRLRRQ